MPQALILAAPATFGAGAGLAMVTAGGSLTALGIATSIGGSLLLQVASSQLNKKARTKPENIKLNLKQSIGARIMHIGRVRTGGTIVFYRTFDGTLFRVMVHGYGKIDGVEQYILADAPVTIDGGGWVTDGQYIYHGTSRVQILGRPGDVPSYYYSNITPFWPEYDATRRLDGLWTSYTSANAGSTHSFGGMYPNGEPTLELVARTSQLYDPRTGLTTYSDNAALGIAHLIEHPEGFNLPGRMNAAMMMQAANDADAGVALSVGGVEPRYRLAGSWALDERPGDVLQRMLDACGGSITLLPDGTIGLRMGVWTAPTVTITDADVIELQSYVAGPDKLDRYTELPYTYVDPALSFTEASGTWVDAGLEATYGTTQIGSQLDLGFSPSGTQAARVAKIRTARDNPARRVTIKCHPRAIRAIYDQAITLNIAAFGLTGNFWVNAYNLSIMDGAVTLDLSEASAASFGWTTGEEPAPQVYTGTGVSGSSGIPLPVSFVASANGVQISGTGFAAGISAAWDAPANDAYSPRLQYRSTSVATWTDVLVNPDETVAQIRALTEGATYDLQLAWLTPGGAVGPFAQVLGVTASADSTPPSAPTSLAVYDIGASRAQVQFIASSTPSIWKSEIFRDAVLIDTIYTAPSEAVAVVDSCGVGTFDWTVRSINVSGVPSATDAGPITLSIS